MSEGDKNEDPAERRNLRYKYRQLITDTERRLMPYVMKLYLYFIRTYIGISLYILNNLVPKR